LLASVERTAHGRDETASERGTPVSWFREEAMSKLHKRAIAISFVTLIGTLGAVWQPASAEETSKFRVVSHSTGVVTIDAADGVDGHTFGAAKFVGIALFDDGRVGSVAYFANFDYTKGSGTYSTFETIKFDDGSILRFRNAGTAALEGAKTSFSDGKFEIVGGDGKYKGASGTGVFTGKRVNPIAEGGDSYFDETATLQLK
jgi:hypothetical protein